MMNLLYKNYLVRRQKVTKKKKIFKDLDYISKTLNHEREIRESKWVICDHAGMKKCKDKNCIHRKKHLVPSNDSPYMKNYCINYHEECSDGLNQSYPEVNCIPWKQTRKKKNEKK